MRPGFRVCETAMTDNDQVQWLRDDVKTSIAEVKAEIVGLSSKTEQQARQTGEMAREMALMARRQDEANGGAAKAAARIVELETWRRSIEIALAEGSGEARARKDTVLTRGQWTLIVGAATGFAALVAGAVEVLNLALRALT